MFSTNNKAENHLGFIANYLIFKKPFSKASKINIFSPKANTQTKVCWLLIQTPHHTQTKNLKQTLVRFRLYVAERVGFEPTIPFRGIHDFQSCSFDPSDISP